MCVFVCVCWGVRGREDRGFFIMDSSICVATITWWANVRVYVCVRICVVSIVRARTGLPARLHSWTISFWAVVTFLKGISTPIRARKCVV